MKYKKIILDILTTIIIILLMDNDIIKLPLHEILGVAILFLFIIHKYFNWTWIKNITLNLFNKQTPTKTKIMYWLDLLLLILLILNVLSGIFISQKLFTYFNAKNISLWSNLHHFFAYSFLVVIAIHLGLHWQYIMNVFKKIFKIEKTNFIIKTILRIISLGIATLGITSLLNPAINKNFIPIPPTNNTNEQENTTVKKEVIVPIIKEKTVTLEEYLSKLYCNGCNRRCPLTSPQCIIGETYREQKIQEYNLNNQEEATIQEIAVEEETVVKATTQTTTENEKEPNVINYISILGLFVGGTHYISKIPKKKK